MSNMAISATTVHRPTTCINCKAICIGSGWTFYFFNEVGPVCENCRFCFRGLTPDQLSRYILQLGAKEKGQA